MKKYIRMAKSFYKNIIVKRKFKSYWQSFVDPEYRAQLNELYEITKHSSKREIRYVKTSLLVPGHKIIYPDYALSLLKKVYDDETVELEPIRVIEHEGKFVVVDGNHRLPAIIERANRKHRGLSSRTKCEVYL